MVHVSVNTQLCANIRFLSPEANRSAVFYELDLGPHRMEQTLGMNYTKDLAATPGEETVRDPKPQDSPNLTESPVTTAPQQMPCLDGRPAAHPRQRNGRLWQKGRVVKVLTSTVCIGTFPSVVLVSHKRYEERGPL